MNIFKQIIRVIVRTAIRLYFIVVHRVKVIGTENIPKDKKEPLSMVDLYMFYDFHNKSMVLFYL